MKFLKKDMTEGGYVSEAVEHIALSKPGVSVKFIKDQKILFHTPGDGEPYSAIYCVYGADFAASLIPTALQIGSIDVSGFVSKPSASRGNRSMQAFFVNGRHVRSKLLQAALEGAYKNRLLTGRFPSCVLDVKVPFSTVDVNVHPAKTEIKFSEEKKVFEAVYAAVKSALDGFSDRPEIVLYTRDERRDMLSRKGEKLPDETPPVFVPSAQKPAEEPKAYEPKVITMPEQSGSFPLHDCKGAFYQPVQSIYQTAKTGDAVSAVTLKETAQGTKPEAEAPRREPPCETESVSEKLSDEVSFRMIGEAFGTYILAEDSDGLLIIDKHAAHERIIFDGLKKGDIELAPQLLLTPEVFSVGRLEASVIKEHLDDFLKLGFDIGEFGENSFIVRQVPPYIDSGDVTILLGELVKKIRDSERLGLDLLDELLHSVSCKAAVKAKSRMQPDELYEIAKRVVETPELQFCPHGRPVAVRLTSKQLEKQFFRIV